MEPVQQSIDTAHHQRAGCSCAKRKTENNSGPMDDSVGNRSHWCVSPRAVIEEDSIETIDIPLVFAPVEFWGAQEQA